MLLAMPLVKVVSSAPPLPAERARRLLCAISGRVARLLEKPESYVMTCLAPPAQMTFGGTDAEPVCYVEVKNIGTFTPALTRTLSAELTEELASALGVRPERTYIEFTNAEPHLWGHAGETFAD
jgi:phenylpyruvate tautomerase PptA (4-oxalocrotonate tautomerase family)